MTWQIPRLKTEITGKDKFLDLSPQSDNFLKMKINLSSVPSKSEHKVSSAPSSPKIVSKVLPPKLSTTEPMSPKKPARRLETQLSHDFGILKLIDEPGTPNSVNKSKQNKKKSSPTTINMEGVEKDEKYNDQETDDSDKKKGRRWTVNMPSLSYLAADDQNKGVFLPPVELQLPSSESESSLDFAFGVNEEETADENESPQQTEVSIASVTQQQSLAAISNRRHSHLDVSFTPGWGTSKVSSTNTNTNICVSTSDCEVNDEKSSISNRETASHLHDELQSFVNVSNDDKISINANDNKKEAKAQRRHTLSSLPGGGKSLRSLLMSQLGEALEAENPINDMDENSTLTSQKNLAENLPENYPNLHQQEHQQFYLYQQQQQLNMGNPQPVVYTSNSFVNGRDDRCNPIANSNEMSMAARQNSGANPYASPYYHNYYQNPNAWVGMQHQQQMAGMGNIYYGMYYPNSPEHQIPTQKQVTGPDGANLFVFNFPRAFTNSDLYNAFENYGKILSATVFIDKNTGRSKCFGFVSYDAAEAAADAIKQMNGTQLGGKVIKVQLKRESHQGAKGTG